LNDEGDNELFVDFTGLVSSRSSISSRN